MVVRQRNALECRFIKQKFLWDSFIQYHILTNQEKIISICLLTIRKAITVKAGQEATYIMRPPVNETSPKSSRWRIQYNTHQGSKLGGAGSRGLPWILLWLPQISAGSPKIYWFLYTTPLGSFRRWNWAPWIKS